jgi:hypothetical protein
MSLVEKVDEILMAGATKTARAWNWTTGRTKADLANTLVYCGGALISVVVARANPDVGPLVALGTIYISYDIGKSNKRRETAEVKALESNQKSLAVETWKDVAKVAGPIMLGLGGVLTAIVGKESIKDGAIIGAYTGSLTASTYIMRTEYLPPCKSVFARAADKMKAAFATPQPAYATAN